jgi:hypothetical protein
MNMPMRQMAMRAGLTVMALVGLTGLVWMGLARSQNAPNPEPAKVQPRPVQPVQIQPLPAPARPKAVQAKPVQQAPPVEQAGDDPPGAAGGGVQPNIGVVPQPLGWEYRVVEFTGRDCDEHAKVLNRLAAEGWEYVGLINLYSTQTNGTTNGQPSGLVAFRRPKFGRPVPLPQPLPPGAEPGQLPAKPAIQRD